MSQGLSAASMSGPRVPETLAALKERGDHYATLNTGLGHLADHPDDEGAVLLSCSAYIALGLFGPACELLRGMEGTVRTRPDFQAVLDQVENMPSGRLAWSTFQSRFEGNTTQLYQRYPDMRKHNAAFRDVPSKYELYRSIDGNLHLSKRSGDGRREWPEGLRDVKNAMKNATLPHNPNANFCGPYLIAGDRWNAVLDRVFTATQDMFLRFSPRIFVIEPDLVAFGAMLHTVESVERLCHDRTAVFVGPDCVERLATHFERDMELSAPEFAAWLTNTGKELCDQALHAFAPRMAALERKLQDTLDAIHRHYDGLEVHHWKERFSAGGTEPLRVLGLTSRFTTYLQYSMRDWGRAFMDRGHEFRVLIERNDYDLLPRARTAEVIAEYKPDLVVVIDHLRHEYGPMIPANVPLVCWVQDLLPNLTTQEAGRAQGPLDFFIAPDPSSYVNRYAYPAERGLAWTMATDGRTYDSQPMREEQLAPHRCDLSYVSNHSTEPHKFHEKRRTWFLQDEAALRLADLLYERLTRLFADSTASRTAYPWLLEGLKEETGLVPSSDEIEKSMLHNYLYPLAELMLRQSTLEWVADDCDRSGRTLFLYGNGWEGHPRFAKYARGFAKNGQELRAIYQASAINLQIIGTGAVHQRLLDGLAAGGFFLIRATAGDRVHERVEQLLAAVRKCKPEADRTYPAEAMPELAAAIEAYWRFRGVPDTCREVRVTREDLDNYLEMEAGGFPKCAGAVFERYDDVAFSTAEEFERLADRYLTAASDRAAVAESMRETVIRKYTYGGLVETLLAFLGQRLAETVDRHRQEK